MSTFLEILGAIGMGFIVVFVMVLVYLCSAVGLCKSLFNRARNKAARLKNNPEHS